MAIENKDDKQIKDLLENNYPLKAIKVDFNDLNNKSLIIKSSFIESYKRLDDSEKKDNWFFIVKLNTLQNCIDVIGLVDMTVSSDGWLNLYYLETSKIFKDKNFSKEIIIYLKRYVQYQHFKGITAHCEKPEDMHLFKFNDFKSLGNNSLA